MKEIYSTYNNSVWSFETHNKILYLKKQRKDADSHSLGKTIVYIFYFYRDCAKKKKGSYWRLNNNILISRKRKYFIITQTIASTLLVSWLYLGWFNPECTEFYNTPISWFEYVFHSQLADTIIKLQFFDSPFVSILTIWSPVEI